MAFEFCRQYVIDSETGEILDMERRVTELSELMKEMAAKQALFDMENAEMIEKIEKLKENIKTEILEKQESVTYSGLKVIWSKGKTTWDTKALNGYVKTHPELETFRKVGNPVVSFSLQKEKLLESEAS
jgi:hypothetical protein